MAYPPQPGRPEPYGRQHPYGQQGRYGQQAPYGQQYGRQQGYPGGEPPKPNHSMIIAMVVVSVLVLGGAGMVAWLLNRDDGATTVSGSPTTSTSSEPTTAVGPTTGPTTGAGAGGEAGGGDGTDDVAAVEALAQRYADAVNSEDEAAATELMCEKADAGTVYTEIAGKAEVAVGEVEMFSDAQATVDFVVRGGSGLGIPMPFDLRDGAWCVSI